MFLNVTRKIVCLGVLAALAWSAPALAEGESSLMVHDAFAFQTAPNQKNGAVFAVLHNAGDENASLVGVDSDIAERVEIHTMSMTDSVMEMRRIDSLPVAAHGMTKLEPMGNHIMLLGLKHPLQVGETFPVTLTFDGGHEIKATVEVVPPGQGLGMDHSSMDHGSMDHGSMDHGSMDHGSMDHGSMDHSDHH